jgi:hypothetical protein
VNSQKIDELTGRIGGEIVDKDARAKYAALLGDEGLAFLDDLSDASRLLEKNKALSEGEKLTSPKVFTKELLAAKSGLLSQGARAAVDLATAIPRMSLGAALRNPAVNEFLATGKLPSFIPAAQQAGASAVAPLASRLTAPNQDVPSTSATSRTIAPLSRR